MKLFYSTFFVFCALLLGCTPMPVDQMESGNFVQVLQSENADFSVLGKFENSLEDYADFLFFLDKNLEFRAAAISYKTVDPNGNEVIASGVVYHPINKKSKGVIDMLPTANLDKYGGGSEKLYVGEGIYALLGYTIILPDLLGFGVSKEMEHPFLMAENTGRVAYDMRRAAAEYLWKEFQYQLPAETTIMGYSLGGSAALAVQKYYETNHPNTVKVTKVFAGGGTYDLPAAFNEFAGTGISGYAAIPSVIIAFNHYYKLNLDFSKIFKGALLENWQDWFDRSHGSGFLREHIGTDIHAYMHEDFFNPLNKQNEEFKKLQPILIENSVSEGWTPKAPIYLTHALIDTYVPGACATAAASKLNAAGGNVTLTFSAGDHFTVGYNFLISILISLL